jgi:hypothetical protein
LVGDGCFAAFDDPRTAVAFAQHLCKQPELDLRAAVAAGLVEIVQGELVSAALVEAASQVRHVQPGSWWVSPIVTELLTAHELPAGFGQAHR